MAAFQNFVIMPMTFLSSGVFYSIHVPCRRSGRTVSHLNPFFYMIDGFRYGFFGVSDVSPWLSLAHRRRPRCVVVGVQSLSICCASATRSAAESGTRTSECNDCRPNSKALIATGLPLRPTWRWKGTAGTGPP